MAHLLGAKNLGFAHPNRVLLNSVTLGISEGDRIGVVGRNGEGKSTLIRILSGDLEHHGGEVTARGGLRIGSLTQTDASPSDTTIAQSIVGDRPEHEWASDPSIRGVLEGLIADLDWNTPLSDLSGGQRRRVALAELLVGDHDLIFLDEPTNHLDLAGVHWLADHLKQRWPKNSGALVVVTHDRWFLDEVSHTTWEVHDGEVDAYDGGYAAYILQKVERERQEQVIESKRQNLMKKELAWLRRGAPARTAKPKFRIEAANQLIADVPPLRNTAELTRLATSRQGKDVVDFTQAGFAFDDLTILEPFDWSIGPGDRFGILGRNGSGKSTLLSLIAGTQPPSTGRVKHGKTVKIAHLSQQLSELQEFAESRVSDVVGRYRTSYQAADRELSPSQLLERLGFSSDQLSARVKDLSGGQRRRLQLLLILLDEPNLLILDEPTNDMDTEILASLEDLLDSWPGTLIVVSHDRYLLERTTDHQYALLDGKLRHLPGGVDEYLRQLRAEEAALSKAVRTPSTPSQQPKASQQATSSLQTNTSKPSTVATLSGAERRALEKELASIDRKLEKVAKDIATQERILANANQSDYLRLGELTGELTELREQQSVLEERWLEIGELLG